METFWLNLNRADNFWIVSIFSHESLTSRWTPAAFNPPTLFCTAGRKRLPLRYFCSAEGEIPNLTRMNSTITNRNRICAGIFQGWNSHRDFLTTASIEWHKLSFLTKTNETITRSTHDTQNQRGHIFTIERNRRHPFATPRQSSAKTKRQFEIRLQFHSIETSRKIYNSKWTDSCCKGMALDRKLVPSPIGESDQMIWLNQSDSPEGKCCPLFPSSALFYPHLSLQSMPLFHHPHHS